MTTSSSAGLGRVDANHSPLSPIDFLERAARVWPESIAVVHGRKRVTWRAFRDRCRRLADGLLHAGIRRGDTVSVLLPNIPEMLECHYGIPMAGAVLNPLNTRLQDREIAFILGHCQARVLIVDSELADLARRALGQLENPPSVIVVEDSEHPEARDHRTIRGATRYEDVLAAGSVEFQWTPPVDEWDTISVLYTSGTVGNPKGVVFQHRGAYLNTVGQALVTGMRADTSYLWTLPMFHCNGWCFTWALAIVGGRHVCLRNVSPERVFQLAVDERVNMLCGAPTVLTMLIHAPESARRRFEQRCDVYTGGAPPPAAVIQGMEELGFSVTHLYGLTETFGPATVGVVQDGWTGLSLTERARRMARQGVPYPTVGDLLVADPDSLVPVPADGETVGEILIRGNTVMKGYLDNPEATREAFRGGWFHSGDLAVVHQDGYVEVRDRAKDIIISGGENISSIEVEDVLHAHPAVMEAAVVGRAHPKWGERPVAFVTPTPGIQPPAEHDLRAFCRDRLAGYKVPDTFVFGDLPKTSTGKVRKTELREQAAGNGAEESGSDS
jgi:fatty-acyl-CoA synthase